jgi:guanylate kinase
MAGILFIVSAPSGSGKSTLVTKLRQQVGGLEFSISWTTRAPRGGEVQDREYHFATRQEFEEHIDEGGFLEWATVYDNYYGTSRKALRDAEARGSDLLLDIDVQGALQVMEKFTDSASVFIVPPSPAVLEHRLRARSEAEKMTVEEILQRRLRQAKTEMREVWKYKYAVLNDDLDLAVMDLCGIVMAERYKRGHELQLNVPAVVVSGEPDVALAGARAVEIAKPCETAVLKSSEDAKGLRDILSSFGVAE